MRFSYTLDNKKPRGYNATDNTIDYTTCGYIDCPNCSGKGSLSETNLLIILCKKCEGTGEICATHLYRECEEAL